MFFQVPEDHVGELEDWLKRADGDEEGHLCHIDIFNDVNILVGIGGIYKVSHVTRIIDGEVMGAPLPGKVGDVGKVDPRVCHHHDRDLWRQGNKNSTWMLVYIRAPHAARGGSDHACQRQIALPYDHPDAQRDMPWQHSAGVSLMGTYHDGHRGGFKRAATLCQ
eukprot:2691360-Amphidinium_carterae.1